MSKKNKKKKSKNLMFNDYDEYIDSLIDVLGLYDYERLGHNEDADNATKVAEYRTILLEDATDMFWDYAQEHKKYHAIIEFTKKHISTLPAGDGTEFSVVYLSAIDIIRAIRFLLGYDLNNKRDNEVGVEMLLEDYMRSNGFTGMSAKQKFFSVIDDLTAGL